MAHTPLKLTIPEAQIEVNHGWASSYRPERNAEAIAAISDKPLGYRIGHLIARLCFRGIYFPQMGKAAWLKVIWQNRRTIYQLTKDGWGSWRTLRKTQKVQVVDAPLTEPIAEPKN